jgi:hypothetical protein
MPRGNTTHSALRALTLLLCLSGLAWHVDRARAQAPVAPAAAERAAPADDAARSAHRGRVFSRLRDVTLTVGEIEDDIQRRSPFARRQFQDRERLVAHARELFRAKLLAHAADQRGYGDRPSVRALIDRHLVAAVVRRQVDEPHAPTAISAEEARTYFDEHRDLFTRAEQRRASHILVASRERAAVLLTQVREGDLRVFRQLAMAESLDTETNQRGGDLGFFAMDGTSAGGTDAAITEGLAQAAFALTREEPVAREPVELETAAGQRFSVVRLTGIREGANPRFEDVEPSVRRRLAVERRDGAYRAYIAELRMRHQVQMQPLEVLRAITLPAPPMPHSEPGGADGVTAPEPATEAAAQMTP